MNDAEQNMAERIDEALGAGTNELVLVVGIAKAMKEAIEHLEGKSLEEINQILKTMLPWQEIFKAEITTAEGPKAKITFGMAISPVTMEVS